MVKDRMRRNALQVNRMEKISERLAISTSGTDELEVRQTIGRLIKMELLKRIKPGIFEWVG